MVIPDDSHVTGQIAVEEVEDDEEEFAYQSSRRYNREGKAGLSLSLPLLPLIGKVPLSALPPPGKALPKVCVISPST